DVDTSGAGMREGERGVGFGRGGSGGPTRGWESALGGHKDLRGKGRTRRAGGRKGYAVSQTGSGVAGPLTRRPCRQRGSRGLPDHAVLRARSTRAFPVTAPRDVIMMTDARKKTQGSFQMHRRRGGERRCTRTAEPSTTGSVAVVVPTSIWA